MERDISRQLAVIDDWQNFPHRKYKEAAVLGIFPLPQMGSILVHYGGVCDHMADRISIPGYQQPFRTFEYGTGGSAPGECFFRSSDGKPSQSLISAEAVQYLRSAGIFLALRPGVFTAPKHF